MDETIKEQYRLAANRKPPMPSSPTDAMPGSPEKLAVMEARVDAGYQPHHPDDARDNEASPGWCVRESLWWIGGSQ